MNKYDKVWVPDEDGEFEVVDIDSDTPELGRLSPKKNVIVLTIGELKQAVKDGYDEGRDSQTNGWNDFKGVFEQFLKRKGIEI